MTFRKSTSLILIDPAVQDYHHLINGLRPESEVVVLSPTQDGIEQITQVLADRPPIDSLHIVAHGQPGELLLGATRLGTAALEQSASTIQTWAEVLSDRASVFLYGCRVAAGQPGQAFGQKLHDLLGVGVAASTQLIGSAALGGRSQLDRIWGQVESLLALNPQTLATYPHVLAVLVSETFRGSDIQETPWIFGTGTGTTNPFLTARPDPNPSANGLPGSATPIDSPGNGTLRLTNNTNDQDAFVIYNSPFASNAGLTITFDFFAYSGTGAGIRPGGDGISFFLIDGAQSPADAGAFGGSLGYAQKQVDGIDGIVGGYISVGLDEFGNFSNPADFAGGLQQRIGGPGERQDSIAIRGRGSGQTGYAYIAGTGTLAGGIDNVSATDREAAARQARIDITPAGLLSVKVDLNNDGDFADTDETPPELQNINIITANGGAIPATFKFGFASSTGNATNIHEVRNLLISSFSTPPTVTDASVSVSPNAVVNVTGLTGTDAETSVASYTIVTLPTLTQGTLFLGNPLSGGTPVTAGQQLTPTQLPQLFFRAQPGFSGGSFTYRATDTDGDETQIPGTVTLTPINNQPPDTGNKTISATPGNLTSVGPLPGTDPDGTIGGFTIVSLPPVAQGTLYVGVPSQGGTPVTAGQTLTPAQINQLFFQPRPGFSGGSFTYAAIDNLGTVDPTPATGTLNLINSNRPPTLPKNSTTLLTSQPTNLTGLPGKDPDGTIGGYVVTTVPTTEQGTLYIGNPVGGTPVTVGQRLTPAQIDQLFFQPGTRFSKTSFSYVAVDNQDAISTPRTITLSNRLVNSGTDGCKPGRNLKGTDGSNRLIGTRNSDRLRGLSGSDTLRGKGCDDRINAGRGNDRLFGNGDSDNLQGQQNNDQINGGKGIDFLNGGLGRDRMNGGGGRDTGFGRRGSDRMNGNGGDDTLFAGSGRDRVRGGKGNDFLDGQQANDRLDAGDGDDLLNGGLAKDRMLGRSGVDVMFGRNGNDRLRGGSQDDQLFAGGGRDTIIGGGDNDQLAGGSLRDRFVYRNARHGFDQILDFEKIDRIDVSRIFAKGNYQSANRFDRYLRLQQVGSTTVVRMDANGDVSGGFVNLIGLLNVNSTIVNQQNFIIQ